MEIAAAIPIYNIPLENFFVRNIQVIQQRKGNESAVDARRYILYNISLVLDGMNIRVRESLTSCVAFHFLRASCFHRIYRSLTGMKGTKKKVGSAGVGVRY